MFRRRWSGLPADPVFPSDFRELGYFINNVDEIRSIENPDYYFKYYLTKNERWNERHRFAFNQAVRREIHTRLDAQNFTTIPLPLGTPPTDPHVPIRTTPDLVTASRVVLLFGESCQPLGVLAHRVIGGRGGITRGSVLGLVAALRAQPSSAADPSPPGVLLANAGELWWWPEGRCGLTPVDRHRVPMASAVYLGRYHDPKVNKVAGNRTVGEHVRGVFEATLRGGLVDEKAKVDVIAVGDTAEEVVNYLDDDEVWEIAGDRLSCMVVLGGCYSSKKFKCEGFKRFVAERGRAYIIHHAHLDTPVAGPEGCPDTAGFTSYGCPVFSAGTAKETETMLIEAQSAVLKWMQEVAMEGTAYKNAVVEIFGDNDSGATAEESNSWWVVTEEGCNAVDETEARKDAIGSKGKAEDNIGEVRHNAEGSGANLEGVPNRGEAARPGRNGAAGARDFEDHDDKAKTSDGPDAQEMKQLLEDIRDLKVQH
ncbi:hypothetical protein VTG60DRAFT_1928 [Thermothelomyces hinnuleus]